MTYQFLFLWTILVFILVPSPAYAYLDPGAGAGIIAILAGGFTGIILLFHMARDKVKSFFKKSDDDDSDQDV